MKQFPFHSYFRNATFVLFCVLFLVSCSQLKREKIVEEQKAEISSSDKNIEVKNTSAYQIYSNTEFEFQFEYPKALKYEEKAPRELTYSYKEDGRTVFEKRPSDFYVEFGFFNQILTIRVYDGTLESLEEFEQRMTPSGFAPGNRVKELIELEQLNTTGYLLTSQWRVPEALNDYPITEVRIDRGDKVIRILLHNKKSEKEWEDVFWHIVQTLRFTP